MQSVQHIADIVGIKKKYNHIYYIKYDDNNFAFFRILKWEEYMTYSSILNSFPISKIDVYINIFIDCLIELRVEGTMIYKLTKEIRESSKEDIAKHIADIPAGIVQSVVNFIYSISGADNIDKLMSDLNDVRKISNSDVMKTMMSMMSATFSVKEEDFNNMAYPDILSLISKGENILSGNIPEIPFNVKQKKELKKEIDFEKENKKDKTVE